MLFNSVEFAVFFPAAVFLFFAVPHRVRWAVLLAASYVFYMAWRVDYALLLAVSTITDYGAARGIGRAESPGARRAWLMLSLCVNLGLLFTFKYYNFFGETAHLLSGGRISAPALEFLLPLGISFYTFQSLGYTIDVYRGERVPERHIGRFALYVSFFPQLVAGPIERSARLLPQFLAVQRWDGARAFSGLRLMAWGFFLKLAVADRLGIYVDDVFGNAGTYDGWAVVIAAYFFTFQIYADFSGYSNIAIGAARVMGFDLMVNFRRPFFARTLGEFWRRWHISLSTWFRDYVFIPLGGSRVARRRVLFNVMMVFLVSGLWHGANWTFLAWGAIHGGVVCLERVLDVGKRVKIPPILAWLYTFHVVVAAFVVFRAPSLDAAWGIIGSAWHGLMVWPWEAALPLNGAQAIASGIGIGLVVLVEAFQRDRDFDAFCQGLTPWLRWTFYYGMLAAILILGVFRAEEFIYFQF